MYEFKKHQPYQFVLLWIHFSHVLFCLRRIFLCFLVESIGKRNDVTIYRHEIMINCLTRPCFSCQVQLLAQVSISLYISLVDPMFSSYGVGQKFGTWKYANLSLKKDLETGGALNITDFISRFHVTGTFLTRFKQGDHFTNQPPNSHIAKQTPKKFTRLLL